MVGQQTGLLNVLKKMVMASMFRVQKKRGFRHAYIEALDLTDCDYIIAFSPDGNSIPEKIPELRDKASEGFDMVTCLRYLGSAKSHDDDVITAFGNWLFTRSINILHRGTYTDAMVMFRAINRRVFHELGLDTDQPFKIPEQLFRTKICLVPLLSIPAARKGIPVTEISGDEPERIGGERKFKIIA